MQNTGSFYIGGAWVKPLSPATLEVINPATESAIATIAMGSAADAARAISAARQAFPAFSQTSQRSYQLEVRARREPTDRTIH